MRSFKTALTVIGAIVVLLLVGNTVAYAATGGKFVLGMTNKANKGSVLKRPTSGPAPQLGTPSSGAAPMGVNGKGKVANLNADMVDGYDSSQMVNSPTPFPKSISLGAPDTGFAMPTSTIPAGTYL